MTTHELKTISPYFNLTAAGIKRFELRKNDRNFKTGDILILRHWNEDRQEFSGREFRAEVTCVLESFEGLQPGYCVLSITKAES